MPTKKINKLAKNSETSLEKRSQDDLMIDEDTILHQSPSFVNLTPYEKAFVIEILNDFISENIRTHGEIAEAIGCHRDTLRKIKIRGTASAVISDLLPQIAKADSPQVLAKIKKAIDEDWRAGKFYLEFTGQYIPKSQQAILHANTADFTGNINSPRDIIIRIVEQFANLGYDRQRLLNEIGQTWDQLKEDGQI